MPLTVGEREVRPLTADEVMAMVAAGILGEDEPYELLGGVLTRKAVKGPDHEAVKERLNTWLVPACASDGLRVRVEGCLLVPDRTSAPEPDLMVVAPTEGPPAHPRSALLVIEVAVTSLRTDIRVKPTLYAAAGVPELWVVDVAGRCLRWFGDPRPDGYATERTLGLEAIVTPVGFAAPPLALHTLWAGF